MHWGMEGGLKYCKNSWGYSAGLSRPSLVESKPPKDFDPASSSASSLLAFVHKILRILSLALLRGMLKGIPPSFFWQSKSRLDPAQHNHHHYCSPLHFVATIHLGGTGPKGHTQRWHLEAGNPRWGLHYHPILGDSNV